MLNLLRNGVEIHKMFLIVFVGLFLVFVDCQDAEWSYSGKTGPAYWKLNYPDCDGERQSPMNLGSAVYSESLPILEFNNYEGNVTRILNNGHNIEFRFVRGDGDVLTSENEIYQFVQFHLHWGSVAGRGSEHKIKWRSYDAEIHFVHFDISKFKTFEEAKSEIDGLAVVAVLVKQGEQNLEFQKFVHLLSRLVREGSSVDFVGHVDFQNLLPNSEAYFSYFGSLTTPPCFETVRWFVFKEAITFSKGQLQELRSLKGKHGLMADNYRPIQRKGRRTVYTNDKTGNVINVDVDL